MGQNRPLFVLFSFFSHDKYSTNTYNDKCVDGVLRTWTRGGRMVGADNSTMVIFFQNEFAHTTLNKIVFSQTVSDFKEIVENNLKNAKSTTMLNSSSQLFQIQKWQMA